MMTKRAAIIVTDSDRIYVAEAFIGAYKPTSEVATDPQLLADLRYLVNAVRGPESARVRAALGDDHE